MGISAINDYASVTRHKAVFLLMPHRECEEVGQKSSRLSWAVVSADVKPQNKANKWVRDSASKTNTLKIQTPVNRKS